MLHDMYKSSNVNNDNKFHGASPSHEFEEPNEDAKGFYRLLKDAEQKLYPGCDKFTKLSCVVRLFQMKCLNGWSDVSFDSLLRLLSEILPVGNVLPKSVYEEKKL
ncbi:hypothetical protein PIB30_118014 [Stylosanthes scabra]|uniref:Uncharacterized protein n=1 Tax=Stylosanthes scabra TaxID=79078 RepID=A0ABU6SHM8_9FABA|nr:hypothetical protein [Stylosanthes scabra]